MKHEPIVTMRGYYKMQMSLEYRRRDDHSDYRCTIAMGGKLYYWGNDDPQFTDWFGYMKSQHVQGQHITQIIQSRKLAAKKGDDVGYLFEYVLPLEFVSNVYD